MERIISLGVSKGAYIVVEPEWGNEKTIFVSMQSNGLGNPEYSVELDAKKIRKLRKQLKRALIEIEGDKVKEELNASTTDDWFSVGKKVKIVNRLSGHGFQIGQIVKYVGTTPMGNEKLESLDGSSWYAVHKDDCAPA